MRQNCCASSCYVPRCFGVKETNRCPVQASWAAIVSHAPRHRALQTFHPDPAFPTARLQRSALPHCGDAVLRIPKRVWADGTSTRRCVCFRPKDKAPRLRRNRRRCAKAEWEEEASWPGASSEHRTLRSAFDGQFSVPFGKEMVYYGTCQSVII